MTPKRVAAYVRVSTENQDTTNQLDEIKAWATRHECDIVEVFKDHAMSGAKRRDQRPALDKMMSDAASRKFDAVVVWSLDRLGRSLSHLLELIEDMSHARVAFIAIRQNIDTTSAAGRLLLGVLGSLAEYERELIGERTRAGQARARRAGVKFGRPRIAPDVRIRIHALYANGKGESMGSIAAKLGIGSGTVHRELRSERSRATAADQSSGRHVRQQAK